jgi:hypothetical protein
MGILNPMNSTVRSRRWLTIVAALLLAPALYILSLGPLSYAVSRWDWPSATPKRVRAIDTYLAPTRWFLAECPAAGEPAVEYWYWWSKLAIRHAGGP